MTKSEGLSKIKKPLIIFLIAFVVCIVSVLCLFEITANAESISATQGNDTSISEDVNQNSQGGILNNLLDVNDNNGTLELVILITILSLAPSILIMMTCFTRIIIVFSLLRNAMGTQQTPPNQVLVGLALFLTLFIMMPVVKTMNSVAYVP